MTLLTVDVKLRYSLTQVKNYLPNKNHNEWFNIRIRMIIIKILPQKRISLNPTGWMRIA